jgi:hypothetical protein
MCFAQLGMLGCNWGAKTGSSEFEVWRHPLTQRMNRSSLGINQTAQPKRRTEPLFVVGMELCGGFCFLG